MQVGCKPAAWQSGALLSPSAVVCRELMMLFWFPSPCQWAAGQSVCPFLPDLSSFLIEFSCVSSQILALCSLGTVLSFM